VAAAAAPPEEPPAPDELPLDDFDHIALGALPTRLRRLALPDLLMLRDYELAHARRAGVLTMLENRIAKVELRRDAAPSD
jgi:hypothetical protein